MIGNCSMNTFGLHLLCYCPTIRTCSVGPSIGRLLNIFLSFFIGNEITKRFDQYLSNIKIQLIKFVRLLFSHKKYKNHESGKIYFLPSPFKKENSQTLFMTKQNIPTHTMRFFFFMINLEIRNNKISFQMKLSPYQHQILLVSLSSTDQRSRMCWGLDWSSEEKYDQRAPDVYLEVTENDVQ